VWFTAKDTPHRRGPVNAAGALRVAARVLYRSRGNAGRRARPWQGGEAMALWRLIPVADRTDSRWQDRRIWHDVVVRAPSAALARIVAEQAEEHFAPGHVGNETGGGTGGFSDNALYWVERLSSAEAPRYGAEAGPPAVVHPGYPEENALSVLYAPNVKARREAASVRERGEAR
jgi:hypothetical protein